MNNIPQLIVMLTHNDFTVKNAYEIFEECKNSKAKFWGCKDEPLPLEEMKKLFRYMKECGKTTILEVVAYTEKQCMEGAELAVECDCDILMGTMFYESINQLCKTNNIKYMPFIGDITGRPSVLSGSVDDMISSARRCLEEGVFGFDLLGYRYVNDPVELNRRFVSEINAPVCIAGSVDSFSRLDEVRNTSPWAFTIGSAFFENKFMGSFSEQIDTVCEYMNRQKVNAFSI